MARLLLAVLVLGSPPLLAQRTWIVDAAGGPGSDFRSLATAAQAAADGDRIHCRPGRYGTTVQIDRKSLTLEGEAGAVLVGQSPLFLALQVTNLQSHQYVRITGFQGQREPGGRARLILLQCAGAIVVDSFDGSQPDAVEVSIDRCAQVTLVDTALNGILDASSSQLVAVRCAFAGTLGLPFLSFVRVSGSQVVFAECTFDNPSIPKLGALIATFGSTVVVAGPSRIRSQLGSAVHATDSTLVLDDRAVLIPDRINTNGPVIRLRVPTTYVTPLSVGGLSTVSVLGDPGDQAVFAIGAPGTGQPTPFGPTWLAAGTEVLLGPLALDAQGRWAGVLPVPAVPALQYLPVAFQGVVSSPTRTMMTTPVVRVIR
jgi:hypothetical protein